MTINARNCYSGVDSNYLLAVIEVNKDFDKTLYIYNNDLVEEEHWPYSVTSLTPRDTVMHRDSSISGTDENGQRWTYRIMKISPATYGMLNVFLANGEESIVYSGDIMKVGI